MVISMETVLTVGLNTRSVVCSLKKLKYHVYSVDYFGSLDLRKCADKTDSILKQAENESCGKIIDQFKSQLLDEKAQKLADDVDHIICLSGASPQIFSPQKIWGNDGYFDNKATQYKTLAENFSLPLTFLPSSFDEAKDIVTSHPEYEFLIKPNHGSGGYGVRSFGAKIPNWQPGDFILQEFLNGKIISASVLSTEDEAKTIITSENIIDKDKIGSEQPYAYQGNISPYQVDEKVKLMAEEIVLDLGLIGSNGVDFILNKEGIHVLEVNPRIQGTFECVEKALNVNMAEAHLAACQDKIIDIDSPHQYAIKTVIHAPHQLQIGNLEFLGIHDIPLPGVIIEKNEPICTTLVSNKKLDNCIKLSKSLLNQVYQKITPLTIL
jgi:predicted ATP-grasp superfamily ATP-dependent carboligase